MNVIEKGESDSLLRDIQVDAEGEDVCAICLGEFTPTAPRFFTQCKHVFHKPCLNTWIKTKNICPYCTQTLDNSLQFESDSVFSTVCKCNFVGFCIFSFSAAVFGVSFWGLSQLHSLKV